jgi:hypothetical protein
MIPRTYGWYPASQPAPHVAILAGQVAPLETIYMIGGQGVLQLDRLPSADLRLRRPLAVHVAWSPETGAYAATAERDDLWFGLGSSPQAALTDLAEVLVMVYQELASDPAVLAAPLRRQFAALQQLITPCLSK